MARHVVKCKYCGEEFDTNEEEYQVEGRRYSHLACWGKKQEENDWINKIHDLMKSKLQDGYSKYKIDKQIKTFLDEGKKASGIYKTLEYWYVIKNADTSKANGGIGIVPFVYQEAKNYHREQKEQEKNYKTTDIEIAEKAKEIFTSPKPYIKKKRPIQKPKKVTYFELD